MGGLTQRIKDFSSFFGINWGTPGRETWQDADDFVRLLDFGTGNKSPLRSLYAQHPVVATAVQMLAEDAAGVPWYVAGDKDADPVEHPVIDLLDRPSEMFAGNQLKVATLVHYLLSGEFFWYFPEVSLDRAAGNIPALQRREMRGELELLPPALVKVKRKDGVLTYGRKTVSGAVEPLEIEALTHHRRYNPENPDRGLSALAAAQMDLEADFNASQWNRNYFGDQNGIPAGMLKPQAGGYPGDETQRREILRTWNQKNPALKRNIGILPPGWDFDAVAQAHKDMDFRSLREYAREVALGLLGVPPFKAGVLDKANYANARKQEELYWSAVRRLLTGVMATLNYDFLPKLGVNDLKFFADWESVNELVEDYKEKVETASKLWLMGVPLEQVNDRVGLGIDTDGLEGADMGFLPAGVRPVDQALKPPAPPPQFGQEPPEGDDEEEAEPDNEREPEKRYKSVATHNPKLRAIYHKNLTNRTKDIETDFEKAIRSHFKNLEQEALSGFKGYFMRRGVVPVAVTKIGDKPPFDMDDANRALRKRVEPLVRRGVKRGGESAMQELLAAGVLDVAFDLREPRMISLLAELGTKITRINETVRKEVMLAIQEAAIDGQVTQESVAAAIRESFETSLNRARTIARTEVGTAFQRARTTQYVIGGIKKHEWLADPVEDSRPHHIAEDGQVVEIGYAFPNTGLTEPHDPNGAPEDVINCRCRTLPVVDRS